MQYQKDEMRIRMIEEALKEFEERGYSGASIRRIVSNANTSVGNIYKYFKSKDDLFQKIIGPVYDKFQEYFKKFDNVEFNEKARTIFSKLNKEIFEMIIENDRKISILFNQSKGSRYENCKKTFADFATRIYTQAISYRLAITGKRMKNNLIIRLVSNSIVESFALAVKEKLGGEEMKMLMHNLIDVFYTGLIDKLETEDIN